MAQERPHVFVPRRSALLRAGGTWSLWTLSRSVKSLRVEKSAGPARPSTSQERVLSAHPRLSWVAVRPSSAQLELGFAIVTRPVVVPDVLWTPALPGVFFFFLSASVGTGRGDRDALGVIRSFFNEVAKELRTWDSEMSIFGSPRKYIPW